MPSASSFCATACPIPLAVPVTIAVFSSMGVTYPVSCETTSKPADFPVALVDRVAESTLDAWGATVTGLADYWTGALRRGATPLELALDGVDWWTAMLDRKKPDWSSPNEVVLDGGFAKAARLQRRLAIARRADRRPAAAGRAPLLHRRLQPPTSRRWRRSRPPGLERAYSLDWVGATAGDQGHAGRGLRRVHRALDRRDRRRPVNLIGDCQGGWLAAIYAALHPEQVNTLTLAGAPIDFHAGGGVIAEWVRRSARTATLASTRRSSRSDDGVMPGQCILGGFIAIKPENELGKQLQLLADLRRPRARRPLPRLRGLVQAHAGRRRARSTCGWSSTSSARTS